MFRYVNNYFNITVNFNYKRDIGNSDIGNLLYFILGKPMTTTMIEGDGTESTYNSILEYDLLELVTHDKVIDLRSARGDNHLTTDGKMTFRDVLRRALGHHPGHGNVYSEQDINEQFSILLPYIQYRNAAIPTYDATFKVTSDNLFYSDENNTYADAAIWNIIPSEIFFLENAAPQVIRHGHDRTEYDLRCLIIHLRGHFIVHYKTDYWYEYDDVRYGSNRNHNLNIHAIHPKLENPYQSSPGRMYPANTIAVSLYIRRPA